jgi:hypothetical protein
MHRVVPRKRELWPTGKLSFWYFNLSVPVEWRRRPPLPNASFCATPAPYLRYESGERELSDDRSAYNTGLDVGGGWPLPLKFLLSELANTTPEMSS